MDVVGRAPATRDHFTTLRVVDSSSTDFLQSPKRMISKNTEMAQDYSEYLAGLVLNDEQYVSDCRYNPRHMLTLPIGQLSPIEPGIEGA